MFKGLKLSVGLLAALILSGCVGTGMRSTSGEHYGTVNGKPNNFFHKANHADTQLALADRGLYFTKSGMVALLDTNRCKAESVAHRGDYRYYENSRGSITHALYGGFDTVEIDIFHRKRDGFRYIVTHDKKTGRASGRMDGKRVDLTTMPLNDLVYVSHRASNGQLTRQRIPTFSEAYSAFLRDANSTQKLNIELKGDHGYKYLDYLNTNLVNDLGQNFYFSSMNLNHLAFVRSINPNVYLNFIQKPSNQSISVKKRDYRKGVKNDFTYLKYQSRAEMLASIGQNRYSRSNRKTWYTPNGLNLLKKVLGSNSGISVDVRTYSANPHLLSNAHRRGMKVHTYTINDNKYHMRELIKNRKKKRMPDGVIADMSSMKLCQVELGGFKNQKLSNSSKFIHPIAIMINDLPSDADFDVIGDQVDYVADGFYITYLGDLKSMPGNSPSVVKRSTIQKARKVKKDKGVSAGGATTITVNFPID